VINLLGIYLKCCYFVQVLKGHGHGHHVRVQAARTVNKNVEVYSVHLVGTFDRRDCHPEIHAQVYVNGTLR
jgi:hypothetical protein